MISFVSIFLKTTKIREIGAGILTFLSIITSQAILRCSLLFSSLIGTDRLLLLILNTQLSFRLNMGAIVFWIRSISLSKEKIDEQLYFGCEIYLP
jgi:hypothetical protein